VTEPGGWAIAIVSEQIEWSPAERSGHGAKGAIKELADIIDKALPPAQWHVVRRPVGMEAGEALGPAAPDATVVLDDRGALFLDLAPRRGECLGCLGS
jgi:hypothetical protein